MATPNALLQLHLDEGDVPKGPRDRVSGTVVLDVRSDILISHISVTFSATATWIVSPYKIWESFPKEQVLFSETTKLISNDVRNPGPPTKAGKYQYDYRFVMPEADWLPPSFACMRATGETKLNCVYIFYKLHATASLRGNLASEELKDECNVFYWPTRLTELESGHMPVDLTRPIQLPRSLVNTRPNKGLAKVFDKINGPKLEPASLVVSLPRFGVLGDALPITLRCIYDPGRAAIAPVPHLESANYTLLAVTRIGQKGSHYCSVVTSHIQRSVHRLSAARSFDERGYLALDVVAPFVAEPLMTWDTDMHNNMAGPVCPSFEYSLAARSYRLELTLGILCDSKRQLVTISGPEMVLLPTRLDSSVRVLPPEMPATVPHEVMGNTLTHEMAVPMPELSSERDEVELDASQASQ